MGIKALLLCLLQFLSFFSFVAAIPTEPLRSYVDCSKYGSPQVSWYINVGLYFANSVLLPIFIWILFYLLTYSGCHSKRKMFLRSLGLANLSCSGQFCAEWVSKRCGSVKSTSSSKRSRSYTLQLCCYRFYMEWTFRKRRIHLYLLLVSIA